MYNQVKSNEKNKTDIIIIGPKSLEAQGIDCTYYIEDMSNPTETTNIINQALQDAKNSIMKKVVLVPDGDTIYYINSDILIPSGVEVEGRVDSIGNKPYIREYDGSTVMITMNLLSQFKNMIIFGPLIRIIGGNCISFCDMVNVDVIFNYGNNVFNFNTIENGSILIQDDSDNNKIVNNSIKGYIEVRNSSKNIIVNNIVDGSITNNGTNNLVTNNLLLVE